MDGLDLDLTLVSINYFWWFNICQGILLPRSGPQKIQKQRRRYWMLEICGHARDPDLNTDCQVFHTDAAPRAETYLKAILPNKLPQSEWAALRGIAAVLPAEFT